MGLVRAIIITRLLAAELVLSEACGYADLTAPVALMAAHIFEVASPSKYRCGLNRDYRVVAPYYVLRADSRITRGLAAQTARLYRLQEGIRTMQCADDPGLKSGLTRPDVDLSVLVDAHDRQS